MEDILQVIKTIVFVVRTALSERRVPNAMGQRTIAINFYVEVRLLNVWHSPILSLGKLGLLSKPFNFII